MLKSLCRLVRLPSIQLLNLQNTGLQASALLEIVCAIKKATSLKTVMLGGNPGVNEQTIQEINF